MQSNAFVPRKVSVGYQERQGTYTGKLAYIIYTDSKGVLRKQTSWEGWRHTSITPDEFDNKPTEGFVLNKKAGGGSSGWNSRNTYTRVYDPRGFEFEVSIPNLLYILENASCTKGKGLEGEFVYAWDGTELLLVPVEAPDYKEMQRLSDMLFDNKTFKGKDLIAGATYLTNKGSELVYLGRFDYFSTGKRVEGKKEKRYYFSRLDDKYLELVTGLRGKIVTLVNEDCVPDFAERMDKLECDCVYSPLDPSKYKYKRMSDAAVEAWKYHSYDAYLLYDGKYVNIEAGPSRLGSRYDTRNSTLISTLLDEFSFRTTGCDSNYGYNRYNNRKPDLKGIHAKYGFYRAQRFLENGKEYK